MRNPTNVTTSIITSERGSSRKATSGRKPSMRIHRQTVSTYAAPAGGVDRNQCANAKAITAETPVVPTPMIAAMRRGRSPAATYSTANPKRGSAGTSHRTAGTTSAPQLRRRVRIHRGQPVMNAQDQREPHRDLGGGEREDEDEQDLAVCLMPAAAGTDERKTGRIEHDLDRHEQQDEIAPHEHSREPQR